MLSILTSIDYMIYMASSIYNNNTDIPAFPRPKGTSSLICPRVATPPTIDQTKLTNL